jgi:hypothetical protein
LGLWVVSGAVIGLYPPILAPLLSRCPLLV